MIRKTTKNQCRRILLMFGGKSTEHQVAVFSALHLVLQLDRNYDITALYINRDGLAADSREAGTYLDSLGDRIEFAGFKEFENPCVIMKECLNRFPTCRSANPDSRSGLPEWFCREDFDLVFPVFHGLNGEDGTIQGLLEFLNIPYAGCGVPDSAVCMDKDMTKLICRAKGIPVLDHLAIPEWEWKKREQMVVQKIATRFSLPVFIKPARTGSSIGITRAATTESLAGGLNLAFRFDDKAIVEPALQAPREIMLGIAGWQGEILLSEAGEFNYQSNEYFDYKAKYDSDAIPGSVPADITPAVRRSLCDLAYFIFKSFYMSGYARLDFFLSGDKIFFNEVNTIPSMESRGTFIRSWEYSGISYISLIDKIIEFALKRHELKINKLYSTDSPALSRKM